MHEFSFRAWDFLRYDWGSGADNSQVMKVICQLQNDNSQELQFNSHKLTDISQ